MADLLDRVRAAMRDGGVRVASADAKVYKDECAFCFATAESPGGLYVNMKTLMAVDADHLALDHERSGGALYLHEVARRVPLEAPAGGAPAEPTKLAIGVEGGFNPEAPQYTVEREYELVVMPGGARVPLPAPELPELVLQAVAAIQAHAGARLQDEVATWTEERQVSKYAAGLEQLPCTRPVPMDPGQWRCDETGVTENLWLNLSTGHIGSGRPHWDGSGGNGSALRHFEATGKKYPLVVKLGTITPTSADVYSYAEDEGDMVLDPHLADHLAHWGISMMKMEKTEKTMAELQIEKNLSYEFDRITEAGASLKPLSGPGYIGLKNLGNSCYMNSVLQLLWTLPELKQRYVAAADRIFATAPADPVGDLPTQFAKLGVALVEGKTGASPAAGAPGYDAVMVTTEGGLEATDEAVGGDGGYVAPHAFKMLVGRGHPEFSSMRQQDAQEYFGHLLDMLARAERGAAARLGGDDLAPTTKEFEFQLESRTQCSESGRVAYKTEATILLGLQIPLEAAVNKEDVERDQKRQKTQEEQGAAAGDQERVLPKIPLQACINQYVGGQDVEDYFSAALGRKTRATQRMRFRTFPPYLMVQLKRYYVGVDWQPKKLEVLVDVPDYISLEEFRGSGPQPGEELQPQDAPAAAAGPQPDANVVSQLVGMGFSEAGSKKAALATGNAGVEPAMEWVLAHMGDPGFDSEPAAHGGGEQPLAVDAAALESLQGMGFTERQATAALKACQGSLERAADWLFSRVDDLDAAVEGVMSAGGAAPASAEAGTCKDGTGKYELVGFVSHMGSNTACGHYVCHIKKDGQWAIFNDEKVAVSEKPPRELGYLYLFKRAT